MTAREDRDDSGVQVDRRKFREGGLRRAREQRPQRFDRQPSEARNNERSKRQEIEAAANAVRQMKRDGILEDASPREEAPHFVLFGNDND